MTISYNDFSKVDICSGTVIKAEPFSRAIKPSYKVWVDFGPEIGVLQTSAQVTVHYTPESLIGPTSLRSCEFGNKKHCRLRVSIFNGWL